MQSVTPHPFRIDILYIVISIAMLECKCTVFLVTVTHSSYTLT